MFNNNNNNHRPLAGTKLYCLVTEAHSCEQLAQSLYLPRPGTRSKLAATKLQVNSYVLCHHAILKFEPFPLKAAHITGSDANKTKFLRPRPKQQDQDQNNKTKTTGSKQRHLADLTFK